MSMEIKMFTLHTDGLTFGGVDNLDKINVFSLSLSSFFTRFFAQP